MKFNWKSPEKEMSEKLKKACIDFEYELRPKITKFLLERLDTECCGDLTCFYFDVDLNSGWVRIGMETPQEYIDKIQVDFDNEINGNLNFSALASWIVDLDFPFPYRPQFRSNIISHHF